MNPFRLIAFAALLGGVLSSPASSASEEKPDIPQCLEPVLNQVDVCSSAINQFAAELQTEVNKQVALAGKKSVKLGAPLAFPTGTSKGAAAVLVLFPAQRDGETDSVHVILFPINMGRSVFWVKTCSLGIPIATDIISPAEQKAYLSNMFQCKSDGAL